jgi:TolB protein
LPWIVLLLVSAASVAGSASGGPTSARHSESTSLLAFAGYHGIYVMDAAGTHIHRVGGYRNADHPAWSPDGRKLAFDEGFPSADIYVMNADGSDVTRLTDDQNSMDPAWSPDGRRIAYDNGADVRVMNADGSRQRTVIKAAVSGNFPQPSWSPDGRRIAFSCSHDPGIDVGICVANADGTGVRKLTNRLPGGGHLYDSAPKWSPDGRRIAFYQEYDCDGCDSYGTDWGANLLVAVVNADGTRLRGLTHDYVSADPSWSPLGTEIAYDTPYDAVSQIHVMNADGSSQRLLNVGRRGGKDPAWSPPR